MGEREKIVIEGFVLAEDVPVRVIRAADIGRTTLDRVECHVMECSPPAKFSCDTEQALFPGLECPDRVNRGAC